MIKIYTAPSCSSCRKVKKWFNEQNIPFVEKNIFSIALNDKELTNILELTENGTEDIISERSKIVKESGVDIDSMTVKELIQFIKANPSILKRPIIVEDRKLQVGYNPEDIRRFLPLARRLQDWACTHPDCPKFDDCEHGKDLN